ncbi:hNH endonuclease [Escherichia coli]|uniref:hNH endonuclease n=1 Tax=Escherichia coli TaxID=562 RepID=UPI002FEFAF8F
MESNIKGLVSAGHEMASELKAECGAVDMRSVAKLISDLATQLEVQLVRANALAEDQQKAIESIKQADSAVKLAHEKFSALAAENAGMKSVIEYCINPDNQPEYHDQGMGCGVEDHGYQRDGYSACYYGWESAMERVYSEVIPDAIPETPATDAFLAEVRAQCLNAFIQHHSAELDAHIKNSGEQFDEKSVRIRDIIVSARLFREQIRKGAAL